MSNIQATSGGLSSLELERIIPLAEVSRLTSISVDTIERHHAHLIRRLSVRRRGMKLRDAIRIGEDAA